MSILDVACRQPEVIKEDKAITNMNNPTLISKLPIEIMTEIFLVLEDDLFDYGGTHLPSWEDLNHVLPPLEVTQVCSSWRRMFLSFPPFWTKIILGGLSEESWLDELVRRSQGSPLSIKAITNTETQDCNINHVMKYIAQIRSLELNSGFLPISLSLISGSNEKPIQAPLLEEIRLLSFDYEEPQDEMPVEYDEENLWRIEAPKLKRFHSQPCFPPHSLHKFTDLRVLEVTNQVSNQVILPSEMFIQALSTLRHLERLVWIGRPMKPSHTSSLEEQTFCLPHLRSAVLSIDSGPMLDFFHRVDTNPSCTFELMIDTEWGDSSTLKTLSRAVSDRAKRLRVDEGRGTIADISCDIEGYLVFELHSRPQDTTAENEPDFRLAIDAPKAQWIDQLTRAYMPILLIQSSHALQYILSNDPDITKLRLALTDNLNFNRSFFSLLFQISETHFVMKNVTDLTVHNVHIYFFNDLLVSRTPLFPALEILRITGTGTTDLNTGNAQSELIRQLISSQKSRTLDTVDIRGLDPESALYASLANAAKFGMLGANLISD